MTHYIEADPLDFDDICAIPHFVVEVEVSAEDWGTNINVSAALDRVMLGTLDARGRVDGIELTPAQATAIWGAKAIEAWEASVAETFDASAALNDEADDRGDHDYHTMRDERMDAA